MKITDRSLLGRRNQSRCLCSSVNFLSLLFSFHLRFSLAESPSSNRYIYLHNEWVIEQFNNPDLFPSEQTASSPSFLSFFSLFFRREMIIMWHLNDKHLFDILNPSLFQRNSLIKLGSLFCSPFFPSFAFFLNESISLFLGGAKSSSSLMSHEECMLFIFPRVFSLLLTLLLLFSFWIKKSRERVSFVFYFFPGKIERFF